jgi:hypothetical protein
VRAVEDSKHIRPVKSFVLVLCTVIDASQRVYRLELQRLSSFLGCLLLEVLRTLRGGLWSLRGRRGKGEVVTGGAETASVPRTLVEQSRCTQSSGQLPISKGRSRL